MNTKKIIFGILALLVLAGIIYLASQLGKTDTKKPAQKNNGLVIWTLEDDVANFEGITNAFLEKYPQYEKSNIVIESFDDAFTYNNALTNAFLQGNGPDIFAIQNTDTSFFESAIARNTISANDFRLIFNPVFSTDLIVKDAENPTLEYVKGVPFGYETLGVFYNRKYFPRSSELEDWANFILAMKSLKEKNSEIIPIALGNYSGVKRAAEVLASFFVQENALSLFTTDDDTIKQVLTFLRAFGEKGGDNEYDLVSLPSVERNDIDFFTDGDVASILGFPREIYEIDEIGFPASFLFASPLPRYNQEEKKQAIFYKYFVLSSLSGNQSFGNDFLNFLASDQGQKSIIDSYPYYLPATEALASEYAEKKIHEKYNIVYKNFQAESEIRTTYTEGNSTLFQQAAKNAMNLESAFESQFSKDKSYILCSATKSQSLLNLSSPCVP